MWAVEEAWMLEILKMLEAYAVNLWTSSRQRLSADLGVCTYVAPLQRVVEEGHRVRRKFLVLKPPIMLVAGAFEFALAVTLISSRPAADVSDVMSPLVFVNGRWDVLGAVRSSFADAAD